MPKSVPARRSVLARSSPNVTGLSIGSCSVAWSMTASRYRPPPIATMYIDPPGWFRVSAGPCGGSVSSTSPRIVRQVSGVPAKSIPAAARTTLVAPSQPTA